MISVKNYDLSIIKSEPTVGMNKKIAALCREYRDKANLQPLVREISWAKNIVILSRCKVDLPSPEQIAERLKVWDRQKGGSE